MYWTAGFYPFHWTLPFIGYKNVVQRSPGGGWKFSQPGIVKTIAAPEWLSQAIKDSALNIILEIRPSSQDQSGPARILSISKDPHHQNMIIAQEGTSLVLRLRTPQTSLSGMPSYQIEGAFARLEWQRVDLLVKPEEVQIQINGAQRLAAKLPARALSNWATDYSLALGNEMTFDRPWLGEIRRAEIIVGQEKLDYAREDLLAVPEQYYVPRHNCLVQVVPLSCSSLDQDRLLDWLLNLIGFVPFGILVAGLFPHRGIIRTATLASLVLSLSIEVGQIFLPGRYPSSEDLLLNLVGGALGATLTSRVFYD
jgi:hypothetical protein